MALSAQLKNHGHEVECFIYDLNDLFEAVKRDEFDLVCFTMMTSDVKWVLDGANQIKSINPYLPILCGGAHPTYNKKFIEEKPIDMICIGEGDDVIVEVANPGHPFGVRGVGEVPIVPPLAAMANAIYDAIGVRLTELPMNPPAVLDAILQREVRDAAGG